MITFEIANFMGCRQSRVTLGKLTAICGPNFQGKTSVGRAIYGIMTGDHLIFPKSKRSDANILVHDGESMGMVSVKTDDGSSTVTYPTLAVFSTGATPPQASAVAMGFRSIADMDDKTRSAYCFSLFGIAPTREDLAAAVADANLTPENIDALWKKIEIYGWESVHKDAQGKGLELKGAWQQATGDEKYGSVKAENWTPFAWTPDLINAKLSDLEADLKQAEEWVIATAKDDAVLVAEKERLDKIVDEYIPYREMLKSAKLDYEHLDRLHKQGIEELRKYSGVAPESMKCPHCKTDLIMADKGLVIYTEAAAKKAADDKKMHESIILANDAVSADAEKARISVSDLSAKCKELDNTIVKLSKITLEIKESSTNSAPSDVRVKLQTAKDRLVAFTTKREADKLHRGLLRNAILIDVLSPEGIRYTALTRALADVNKTLAMLSEFSGWKQITLSGDLDVSYGGRRYVMCSESEQFRVRILLQYLVAGIEGAPFVMIDRVDMLDTAGRNRLCRLALKAEIPTLVFMTLDKEADAPGLNRVGGETYWIEGGYTKQM